MKKGNNKFLKFLKKLQENLIKNLKHFFYIANNTKKI